MSDGTADWQLDYQHNELVIGDKVYGEGREPQPNGIIVDIHRKDRQVSVKYWDCPDSTDGAVEVYDMDLFYDAWTPLYGGLWWITPNI